MKSEKVTNSKSTLFFIIILLFSVVASAGDSPGITILGNIGDEKLRKSVRLWANEVAQAGGDIFKACLPETAVVDIANSNAEFDSFTSGRLPDWGIGAADPSGMRIVIKNPDIFRYGQNLGEVVRHEFAHLYLESCCPGCEWPRWFHEGCAVLFSGEWRIGRDITVARAAAFSSLPALKNFDEVNSFSHAQADLAYSMSFLAIRYFIDRFGRGGLKELFDNMRAGQKFPTAFYHTTGLGYGLWENEFKDYLEKRYFFIFWFGDWPVLWTGLVLFFVIIYILKRRQIRRKAAEWEKTENYEYFNDG